MAAPRVSIIVPCFNLGRFVEEAVQSVLDQTYQDFEIVVVDDGSTDQESRQRLDALSTPHTRLIRSANGGLSAARNLGIRHSSGEYICTLDADDRLRPTYLEKSVTLLDASPHLAFASHWVEAFGDQHFDWKPVRCDLAALLDHNVVNGAALFRRSLVDAVGGFDETMREGGEDWEFWIRVIEAGYQGAIIPELLYSYRQRPDSMSRVMNGSEGYLRVYAQLVEKHHASFERHLVDLVLRREWTFADVCRRIDRLDEEIASWLEPALTERRRELDVGRARLAAVKAHRQLLHDHDAAREAQRAAEQRQRELEHDRDILRQQVARLEGEVTNFRHSLSWRLTSPLRRLYEGLGLGTRGRHDQ